MHIWTHRLVGVKTSGEVKAASKVKVSGWCPIHSSNRTSSHVETSAVREQFRIEIVEIKSHAQALTDRWLLLDHILLMELLLELLWLSMAVRCPETVCVLHIRSSEIAVVCSSCTWWNDGITLSVRSWLHLVLLVVVIKSGPAAVTTVVITSIVILLALILIGSRLIVCVVWIFSFNWLILLILRDPFLHYILKRASHLVDLTQLFIDGLS